MSDPELNVRPFKRTSRALTFGTRHPRAALLTWLIATVALAIVGGHVGRHLSARNQLLVPGSESKLEADRFAQEFGSSVSAPVVLSGPRKALDREGPRLVVQLAKLPGAEVVSAWDGGTLGRSLRPAAGRALVLVAVTHATDISSGAVIHQVEQVVGATLTAPVHGHVSGIDAIGAQIQTASLSAVHRAELIAIPILLVVLLIVFGSPIAAVIPAALGFGTVLSSFGIIALLGDAMTLNELATTAASMMGLALGVDYSLVVVARFRDELTHPDDPANVVHAARIAALRAGRTVLFAGGAIVLLMACALTVATGTLLLSAVIGVIVVAALSVAGTVLAAPAALTLFGRGVAHQWWGGIGHESAHHVQDAAHARRSWTVRIGTSTPVVVVCALVLGLVGWRALSLSTGPPDAGELPHSTAAAKDFTAVSQAVGTGWVTPFELLVVAHHGAVTTLPTLNAMAAAQRQIARDSEVASVIGPAELARRAAPLAHAEQSVARTNRSLKKSAAVIGGLNSDLGQAASGANNVQSGFAQATAAVQKLASGGASGNAGVHALQAGLSQAANGSRQINAGLLQAASAAGRIASGSRTLATGSGSLVSAIGTEASAASAAQPKLTALAGGLQADSKAIAALSSQVQALDQPPSGVGDQLSSAITQLQDMRIGRLDGHYKAALAAVQTAQSDLSNVPSATAVTDAITQQSSHLQQAGNEVSSLAIDAGRLSAAAGQVQTQVAGLPGQIAALEQSQRALASGIQRLAASGTALTNGIGSLSSGTAALTTRLSELQAGAAQVASGLGSEQAQAGKLTAALSAGQHNAANGRSTPANAPLLGTLSRNPGFFGSGYLVLAALEGSSAARRAGIDFIVNVAHNGQAARMIVVPRTGVRAAATGALRQRLQAIADTLAARSGATVLLGGPAAQLRDYAAAASRRIPLLVAVLMAATFVLLVVVFRSLFAPLVTVLLNLLSVGAAFGLLSLLSGGRHPVIGGPGYVDALSVSAMFAVVFALSLDYQVFLLMRMREGWQRTGSTSAGVDYGVARTARVVAGAAAIMAGVFLAFASADVATIRQLGVGLAAAIVIDATIVRLVLLPYVLRLGGRLTWWLPAPLARALPVLDIGAERRHPDRSELAAPSPSQPTSLRQVAAVQ